MRRRLRSSRQGSLPAGTHVPGPMEHPQRRTTSARYLSRSNSGGFSSPHAFCPAFRVAAASPPPTHSTSTSVNSRAIRLLPWKTRWPRAPLLAAIGILGQPGGSGYDKRLALPLAEARATPSRCLVCGTTPRSRGSRVRPARPPSRRPPRAAPAHVPRRRRRWAARAGRR